MLIKGQSSKRPQTTGSTQDADSLGRIVRQMLILATGETKRKKKRGEGEKGRGGRERENKLNKIVF